MTAQRLTTAIEDARSPRRQQILAIAAQLFARRGYWGTSIRDIGDEAGLQGGSLYHHIKSKDALFVELYGATLEAAARKVEAAIDGVNDPWARLEAACVSFVEIQLDTDPLTFPLMNDFREVDSEVRAQLIAQRDAFESIFRTLIDLLPLPDRIDRSLFRTLLLSQLNAVGHWYRPGRLSPAEIGRQIARVFRHDAAESGSGEPSIDTVAGVR